jgi:hypothetical protein
MKADNLKLSCAGDLMFRRFRQSIHWEAKMKTVRQEHDDAADADTLRSWKEDYEALQLNPKHKPNVFEDTLFGNILKNL